MKYSRFIASILFSMLIMLYQQVCYAGAAVSSKDDSKIMNDEERQKLVSRFYEPDNLITLNIQMSASA